MKIKAKILLIDQLQEVELNFDLNLYQEEIKANRRNLN